MSQPKRPGRMTAWPRLLTGKSSVTPWISAVKIAWKAVMCVSCSSGEGSGWHPGGPSALDLAGLVDLGERRGEAAEAVGVRRRGTARRGALDDRLLALLHRLDNRLVGRGIARPGR